MRHKLAAWVAGGLAAVTAGALIYGATSSATITLQLGQSLQTAYQSASPGDTICLAPGNWGTIAVYDDQGKDSTSTPVTIRPCSGSPTTVSRLDIGNSQLGLTGPSHIVVKDLQIDFWRATEGSNDIEVNNVTGSGFGIVTADACPPFCNPPTNVRVIGGNYGPCEATIKGFCTNIIVGKNLLIDGATIHDVTSRDLARLHVDGVFERGCQGCTIRNTTFYGNMITNIRIQNCCGLPPNSDIHLGPGNVWYEPLEGDGRTTRADCIDVDSPTPGFVEDGDTYAPKCGPTYDGGGSLTFGIIRNSKFLNVGPCIAGVTYSGNKTLPWSYRGGTDPATAWAQGGWGNTPCGDSTKETQPWQFPPTGTPPVTTAPPPPTTTVGSTTSPATTTASTATTTASTTTTTATTPPPPKPPLDGCRMTDVSQPGHEAKYSVLGYDTTGKVAASGTYTIYETARAVLDGFCDRVPHG